MVPSFRLLRVQASSTTERIDDGQEDPNPYPSYNDSFDGGGHVRHNVIDRTWANRNVAFSLAKNSAYGMAFRFCAWRHCFPSVDVDRHLDNEAHDRHTNRLNQSG